MGWLKLTNPVVVGPMAGVTDSVFRHLAWEQGPALMWTEMISAQAILYRNYRTLKMAALHDCEGPVVIQIFGKEPAIMAEAAKNIVSFGPAAIDINMGCPAPKIVRNGEGAALSLKPQLAAKIVAAVSNAVDIPVMVKIRSGWDNDTINAVTLADRLARNGAAAVTVHGRTRSQFYSGKADLEIIKQVKEAVPIAVVGNGDIFEPEDALRTLTETGCQAVMLARGVLGNPWLIGRTVRYLTTGKLPPLPTAGDRLNLAMKHLDLAVKENGAKLGLLEMRKHLSWYLKGMPRAAVARSRIMELQNPDSVKEVINEYFCNALN